MTLTATSTVIPVDIIHPTHWWQRTKYRIKEEIHAGGERVPRDEITDGASVPRFFWFLFPPVGRYLVAAAVHDHLLKKGVSWRVANRIFRKVLIESHIPKWRRRCMVAGVQIWGFLKGVFTNDDY